MALDYALIVPGFRARRERSVEAARGIADMAFIQNARSLLLERAAGEVRRLPAGFWNNVAR